MHHNKMNHAALNFIVQLHKLFLTNPCHESILLTILMHDGNLYGAIVKPQVESRPIEFVKIST